MKTINHFYAAWTDPSLKPTAICVALVVGTTLFILNHGAAVLEGKMNRNRWLAGLVTYLVPYTVSIHGQHVARSKQR
ncbi:MAG: nitrate/nitrite transporter NrtS [Nostoc sp.]|uniref:nitrate/nitrite transporter NrtS n=1 Tax=Nostoc sp. TaxID=1180 RepID=UPI002FFB38DA